MRALVPLLALPVLLASAGCVPQEVDARERARIREVLQAGVSCEEIERADLCAQEWDRLRLQRMARDLPPGVEPFDPGDAWLCLYPPTVQSTPWSKPRPMPGFECQVPESVLERL